MPDPLPQPDLQKLREVAEARKALACAETIMIEKGWWRNEAGYLTDVALWIQKADQALEATHRE